MIRDVILNGLYDTDIRKEVLGIAEILEKPINEFIALVETKEMARNALPSPTLSAVSSFQRLKKSPPAYASVPPPADRAKEATCPGCHATYKIFTEGARGWNEKPIKYALSVTGPTAGKDARSASLTSAYPRPQGSTPRSPSDLTNRGSPDQGRPTPPSSTTTSPQADHDHARHRRQTVSRTTGSPHLL